MSDFRDNARARRYELDAPEGMSIADYRDIGGVRVIMHVETPHEARGRGYASKLMREVVAKSRGDGTKLRASCAFAVAYFRRHPDEHDVLA
ncbi:MAG: N-acetyltransferase [Hyphomonadaceae bacterium]|nr:N-acetyltransferase [Hyphomonadaceae bacterium]